MIRVSKHINWHEAFCSALQIELMPYQSILTYQPEFVLNKGKRRVDILITKEKDSPTIDSAIGRIFRRYNLLDYKGPDEHMNVANFYKALSYALSLPEHLGEPEAAVDLTLTVVTHFYPRKLFSYLRKKSSKNLPDPIVKIEEGIYDIDIGLFPVQLLVLSQLSAEDYLWLSCLTKHLTKDTPFDALCEKYKQHQEDSLYQTVMDAIIRANRTSKGDEKQMCDALYELFEEQLSQNIILGQNQMSSLIMKLIADNRSADIERVASDAAYRQQLIGEYQL